MGASLSKLHSYGEFGQMLSQLQEKPSQARVNLDVLEILSVTTFLKRDVYWQHYLEMNAEQDMWSSLDEAKLATLQHLFKGRLHQNAFLETALQHHVPLNHKTKFRYEPVSHVLNGHRRDRNQTDSCYSTGWSDWVMCLRETKQSQMNGGFVPEASGSFVWCGEAWRIKVILTGNTLNLLKTLRPILYILKLHSLMPGRNYEKDYLRLLNHDKVTVWETLLWFSFHIFCIQQSNWSLLTINNINIIIIVM